MKKINCKIIENITNNMRYGTRIEKKLEVPENSKKNFSPKTHFI